MSEPKKRGRPTNAQREAKAALLRVGTVPVMNGDTSREPEDVIEAQTLQSERAQAYALKVWAGQSHELKRAERIARVERALQGQSLPTDGIRYPGSDDDEEWDEADMQPVTWRKRS
jgi:hypothetical protein